MTSHTPVHPSRVAHLRARDLHLSRGGRMLLRGIDLTLAPGDRIAVVGENGRGKTTLLAALSGELAPDAGSVERHGSLGVVRQELVPEGSGPRTVGDLLDALLARPLAALRELDAAAGALSEGSGAAAARRYDDALAAATLIGAWDASRRLEVALAEVGALTDRRRALATMSVGQRYRVRLAGVIAARDDLLLLDEPTNHLDARGLRHLAAALSEHPGAAAIVSHDRALLAGVATAYLDLDPTSDGTPLVVRGGFEQWRQARDRHLEAWEDAYRAQQQEHERLQSRAEAARSRLSTGWRPDKGTGKHQRQSRAPGMVRAMNERIDQLQQHRLDVPPPPLRLRLPSAGTVPGTPLLRADQVSVQRGAAPDLRQQHAGITLRLEGGDRLLVVGPNGAGKTTLLQMLAGQLAPSAGSVRALGGARIGLIEQEEGGGPASPPRHRGSPGERRRRALAALFGSRPDVLLLDELTNHLGISGVDDLLAALDETASAVVLATHDRSVLRALSHWPRLELGN
ncbi:MAG: ABC-F family ATP-binding cassette domain-containing protein [Actinomycetales bacterium]|nr:ABC-F family ATP-binding cassette domain-containing protein [Actinomycetales bacterium]